MTNVLFLVQIDSIYWKIPPPREYQLMFFGGNNMKKRGTVKEKERSRKEKVKTGNKRVK